MKVVNRARTVSRFSVLRYGSTYETTPVWDIKYHLARDVYTLVLEHVSKTKSVKCSEIVQLSQRLLDVTPTTFNSLLSSHRQHQSSSLMLNYLCSQYQFHSEHLRKLHFRASDIHTRPAVLLLHKPALVAALLENPVNPLSTEFAPSLLSANRCASFLTHTLVGQFETQPKPCYRFWFPWVQGFCAAMISGSIALHSPRCPLARNAIGDLNSMVELFRKASAGGCRRAAVALVGQQYYMAHYTWVLIRLLFVAVPRPFERERAQRLRKGGIKFIG